MVEGSNSEFWLADAISPGNSTIGRIQWAALKQFKKQLNAAVTVGARRPGVMRQFQRECSYGTCSCRGLELDSL